MDETEQLVSDCFTATFPQLSPETVCLADVDNVESWDSTQMLTLVAMLQEQFGFSIAEKDIFDLTSYKAVVDYVRRHRLA